MADGREVRRRPALWAGGWCLALTVVYVVAPFRGGNTWVVGALTTIVAVVVGAPFAVLRRSALDRSGRPLVDAVVTVLLMLVTVVLGFAAIYETLAHEGGHIPGLDTKLDSVYFTVTTLATVGFGDIHAESQAARAVVTVQMLFDLTVVAVAVRLIVSIAQDRRRPAPPADT